MYKIFRWKGHKNPCALQLKRRKPRDEPTSALDLEMIGEVHGVMV
jgi:hypothetical protein